ncbi:hypothetical protein MPSI1_003079 [Malassezia psittaci]|uniref:Uncharacterized protein n=1 Tax=Malassezia psittaci TaxID=1821823 RepID=A0AAF0FDV9_9BASI|nr:hypothetical protein MPSI1_003079 [Malassezia psittaci]
MFATRIARQAEATARAAPQWLRTKTSTGLAGIDVHPNPLPALQEKYTRTLQTLKALPESAVYRQSAEAVTQQRLDVVKLAINDRSQKDPSFSEYAIKQVTEKIDSGVIEELIIQADDELALAAKMIDWKPYEPLQVPTPPGQWDGFSMRKEAGEGED